MLTTLARPDLTLTLDFEGVIQNAVSAPSLAEERLDDWNGRPWVETVDPTLNPQLSQLIADARVTGASACFQVVQRFPSGREAPLEYVLVSLGSNAGFVAIGRNIQVVAELQSQLEMVQQAREQDYWKIREIETRYRTLFDNSNDAVVLVKVSDLRIVEANLAATKSFGLYAGAEFLSRIRERDKKALYAMLAKVREEGRAPSMALHLSMSQETWSLRASMSSSDAGQVYLFQIAAMMGARATSEKDAQLSFTDVLRRFPESFVFVDREGVILRANEAFLDLAQLPSEAGIIGRRLKSWLSQPGADFALVLSLLRKHGSVRRLRTRVEGALGAGTDVELTAVGDKAADPDYIGVMLKERATGVPREGQTLDASEATLEQIVGAAIENAERRTILAALARCNGNRTTAAKMLGLSRQSLHTKLKRYSLGEK